MLGRRKERKKQGSRGGRILGRMWLSHLLLCNGHGMSISPQCLHSNTYKQVHANCNLNLNETITLISLTQERPKLEVKRLYLSVDPV